MHLVLILLILACLGFFALEIHRAWVFGEVRGKGWWGRRVTYSRTEQPWMFWLTVLSYCAWVVLIPYIFWRMFQHS